MSRKIELKTDFVCKYPVLDTEGKEVIDGTFECGHCGKKVKHDNLWDHFEKCFKQELINWDKENRPKFDVVEYKFCCSFDKETGVVDVMVLPQYKKKEDEDKEDEEKKMPWKLINSNVGETKLPEVILKFCEDKGVSMDVIHIKKNKKGNYSVFYQEAQDE